jgi:hypothetical protein
LFRPVLVLAVAASIRGASHGTEYDRAPRADRCYARVAEALASRARGNTSVIARAIRGLPASRGFRNKLQACSHRLLTRAPLRRALAQQR